MLTFLSKYLSREFLITVLVAVSSVIVALKAIDNGGDTHWSVSIVAVIAAVLAALGYDAARTQQKKDENGS